MLGAHKTANFRPRFPILGVRMVFISHEWKSRDEKTDPDGSDFAGRSLP